MLQRSNADCTTRQPMLWKDRVSTEPRSSRMAAARCSASPASKLCCRAGSRLTAVLSTSSASCAAAGQASAEAQSASSRAAWAARWRRSRRCNVDGDARMGSAASPPMSGSSMVMGSGVRDCFGAGVMSNAVSPRTSSQYACCGSEARSAARRGARVGPETRSQHALWGSGARRAACFGAKAGPKRACCCAGAVNARSHLACCDAGAAGAMLQAACCRCGCALGPA
mmetsp:Transcript_91864/g.256753  ORF Transcript_91864/g.256753 Transcript_91864/m.256753 type:complete len:226 (+) Transcript_91864:201-878(+)